MENNDDFTFSQAGFPDDHNSIEETTVADVSSIDIKYESSKGGTVWNDNLEKETKVGSLTFMVIDASLDQGSSSTTTNNNNNTSKGQKKAASRAKVPFQIGYSPMDWLKLTRTHPDLAGLKGQSNKRLIHLSEVKQHHTEDSMWTVLKGRVYNITPYMEFHPGGVDMLMKAVGKDCTALFNKYHAWVNAEFMLEKCLVGILDESRK